MNNNIGYQTLMDVYQNDLDRKARTEDVLKNKLDWVLKRAEKYAALLGITRDEVLHLWESDRNEWWVNYYQECNQPDPENKIGMPVLLQSEWLAKGHRLYGPDMKQWKFVCPNCKKAQTVGKFLDNGLKICHSYTCCASRFGFGATSGCNWAITNILPMGGAYVVMTNALAVPVFDYADKEDLNKVSFKKGDVVVIYTSSNKTKLKHGEVTECLPGNKYKLRYGEMDIVSRELQVYEPVVEARFLVFDKVATETLQNCGGVIVK